MRDLDALLVAAAARPSQASRIVELIQSGANPNGSCDDLTPIGATISAAYSTVSAENTVSNLTVLLKHGARLDVVASGRFLPLHWAVFLNRAEHVDLLLAHGASPSAFTVGEFPQTALDIAIEHSMDRMIEKLQAARVKGTS